MLIALWLLAAQGALGAFDTLYYHEFRLRLPANRYAAKELLLHALRDFVYFALFGVSAWATWNGLFAVTFVGLLIAEIAITLADFVEEDRIRTLPPGERMMHAVMGIVYGLFLANLLPSVVGILSWLLIFMAVGVLFSGVRDMVSARRDSVQSGSGLDGGDAPDRCGLQSVVGRLGRAVPAFGLPAAPYGAAELPADMAVRRHDRRGLRHRVRMCGRAAYAPLADRARRIARQAVRADRVPAIGGARRAPVEVRRSASGERRRVVGAVRSHPVCFEEGLGTA
jgi:hypothetical protein